RRSRSRVPAAQAGRIRPVQAVAAAAMAARSGGRRPEGQGAPDPVLQPELQLDRLERGADVLRRRPRPPGAQLRHRHRGGAQDIPLRPRPPDHLPFLPRVFRVRPVPRAAAIRSGPGREGPPAHSPLPPDQGRLDGLLRRAPGGRRPRRAGARDARARPPQRDVPEDGPRALRRGAVCLPLQPSLARRRARAGAGAASLGGLVRPAGRLAQPEVKRFLARRVLAMLATALGVTLVAFAVARAAPGDPVALQGDLGLRAGSASVQQMREYRRLMGLDEPFLAGYLRWLWHLFRGDLGTSFRDGRPVLSLLGEALPVTLLLSIPSLLVGYVLALPVGIASAARPGGWLDRALSTLV